LHWLAGTDHYEVFTQKGNLVADVSPNREHIFDGFFAGDSWDTSVGVSLLVTSENVDAVTRTIQQGSPLRVDHLDGLVKARMIARMDLTRVRPAREQPPVALQLQTSGSDVVAQLTNGSRNYSVAFFKVERRPGQLLQEQVFSPFFVN